MTNDELQELFRRTKSALTASLTRVFGPNNMDEVEDVVEDAFVKAIETWPTDGVPESPHAWLLTVARNKLRDQLRYHGTFRKKEPEVSRWVEALSEDHMPRAVLETEIADDTLRMMFVACHPSLAIESQVALALRTLSGLEAVDIAKALLTQESAIEKRLVRARQSLREAAVSFEMPSAEDLVARKASVLRVLYVLFSEGHSAHRGEVQVQVDLCAEAIRLTSLLADHPLTSGPSADALLALMLLQASRFRARADSAGNLLTLAEQDRSQWDPRLIAMGLSRLARSARGNDVSEYHVEAALAACHARAAKFEDTDWAAIVEHYDHLAALNPSPVIGVNRAIAIGMARGPDAGLVELATLDGQGRIESYFLFHAALGELSERAGKAADARVAWERALALAGTEPERRFIRAKLRVE